MDKHPEQPSDDAPELETSDVGDRRTSSNLPRKGFFDVLSHLKCGRGESWDRLPIALDVGQVPYGENV